MRAIVRADWWKLVRTVLIITLGYVVTQSHYLSQTPIDVAAMFTLTVKHLEMIGTLTVIGLLGWATTLKEVDIP